ncbi:exodeoxyribonuclease VII small subunit [Mesoterricola sediminis]|nr:exodeoxyribonuclease VII small subunit [Mesoterricola sediminis]
MTNDPPSFEDGLDRLEALVGRLEAGSLGLEEALQAFEEGVTLSRALQQQLGAAQRRVEILRQGLGGEVKAEPFEGEPA